MAISLTFATGSAVTVSTSEISLISGTTTLQTNTTTGIYQLVLDCNAMTSTEGYVLKVYETAISGGTKREAHRVVLQGAQVTPILISESMILGVGWDMTLTKTGGTDRAFSWSIRQVA